MQEMLYKMNTWMIYLVLLVGTIFVAYFAIAIANFTQKMKSSMKKGGKKKSSLGCVTLLVLFVAVLFLFVVFRYMTLYSQFRSDEMIALINASRAQENLGDFKLTMAFMEKGEQDHKENYVIKGQRWLIKGELLQWNAFMKYVGLNQMQRITHIQGWQPSTNSNPQQRPNSYTLIRDDQNTLWRFLSSACRAVGLVRIRTISTEPQLPNYKNTLTLWITTKGFLFRASNEKPLVEQNQQPAKPAVPGKNKKPPVYPEREEAIKR